MDMMDKNNLISANNSASAIALFAIPIILGNIFQQLYNTVDAIVVGKYLGDNALAAISVANPIMDILYSLFIGSCIGVGVLMAQQYGAQNHKDLKTTTSTGLFMGIGLTVVISIFGLIYLRSILMWQKVPEAVIGETITYLRIIIFGLIFSFLYNYYSSALRACGDSKAPFLILLISSILHAILDVVFIKVFSMGVNGVAISTVLSQFFAALCCIIYAYHKQLVIALKKEELVFEQSKCVLILRFAWAAALQQEVVCVGRFLTQGLLNPLGETTIVGYNMAMRTEAFVFSFSQGIGAASITYIAQNMGAGQSKKVRDGFKSSLLMNAVIALIICLLFRFMSEPILRIFSNNADIIAVGVTYMTTMSFAYIFAAFGEILQCFFRGIGMLWITMAASTFQIVLRVVLSNILVPIIGMQGICYSTILGWVLLCIFEGVYSRIVLNRINNDYKSIN